MKFTSLTVVQCCLLLVLLSVTSARRLNQQPEVEGGEQSATPSSQESRRQLPEGQPNYGLTKSEHQDQYGWADEPGYYGEYGYYDGGDYARGTYGNPWGDANYYNTQGGGSRGGRGGGGRAINSGSNGYY